ncbi:universal stress protein [Gramella sp. MAR_2010_147]|uniref:universal stress protein n=1 Tax=Gramella sp. MAR_2010_147 TaxID=1250205 RepID=UPI00087CF1CE|nr:universal stress protein [Gramella sp. MAR_2010_147]SDR97108.1 Nucleotide-binding universal stress protein, UspA family [Gramella sp. MAR_2010_147]
MEKKILIPTNFSKHSWNALIFSMNLYKKYACTFYLINVYHSQGFLSEAIPLSKNGDTNPSGKELSEKGLERIMQGLSFRKENPNHTFETISFQGSLVDGIQENADKFGVDLIILGSRGDSVHINTSEDISKITEDVEQCPVLVIPEVYEWREQNNAEIVFPTNLRIPFKQKELLALIDFSRSMGAAVRILYINTENKKLNKEQEENREDLKQHLKEVNHSFHILTQTTPATGVHLFIESRDSNFLALYQRKQGFFSRLFSKSAVSEIAFDPKLPVLILKEVQ